MTVLLTCCCDVVVPLTCNCPGAFPPNDPCLGECPSTYVVQQTYESFEESVSNLTCGLTDCFLTNYSRFDASVVVRNPDPLNCGGIWASIDNVGTASYVSTFWNHLTCEYENDAAELQGEPSASVGCTIDSVGSCSYEICGHEQGNCDPPFDIFVPVWYAGASAAFEWQPGQTFVLPGAMLPFGCPCTGGGVSAAQRRRGTEWCPPSGEYGCIPPIHEDGCRTVDPNGCVHTISASVQVQ